MIITPNGNRNGVLGLLNVNSRFKAPVGNSDSDGEKKSAGATDSAVMGSDGGLFEAFSGRIDGIQGELSRSQAREEALQDIFGSLQSMRSALSDGTSAAVSEFRSKIQDAASRTYDGTPVTEGFDPVSLGIGSTVAVTDESIGSALEKVSRGLESSKEETARLTAEVKSLEVSRENVVSSDSRIREAEFAGELLSITTNQISSGGSQELLKGVDFNNILKLLS